MVTNTAAPPVPGTQTGRPVGIAQAVAVAEVVEFRLGRRQQKQAVRQRRAGCFPRPEQAQLQPG